MNLQLKGHSGCGLGIKTVNNQLVVEKTSKDRSYNERLVKQSQKQREFKSDEFKTPPIISENYTEDGLFCFMMEYINGEKLSEYFRRIEVTKIPQIAGTLLSLAPREFAGDEFANPAFDAKIGQLRAQIKEDHGLLDRCFGKLENFDWRYMASSSCHGDLTLENVIYKDGDLYLIDFLDSFYDSWMIDFAKLFQDLEAFWSYRDSGPLDENLEIRLLIFKDLVLEKLYALTHGRKIVATIYHLLLLNLVRIIPYARDRKTWQYLSDNLVRLLEIIENL
jgi:hypothetical protein